MIRRARISAACTTASDASEAIPPFYVPANAAVSTQLPRVFKQGEVFSVLDDFGNAQTNGPAGSAGRDGRECRISDLRLRDAEVDLQLLRPQDDVALHVVRQQRRGDRDHQLIDHPGKHAVWSMPQGYF
jgi:hypothetical protein